MRFKSLPGTLQAGLIAGLVCLAFAAIASAAAPLAYVTPAVMATHITGASPQIPLGNSSVPSVITASTCHGLGAAHQGKFNTFKCKATWLNGQKIAVVWARARAGGQFCASTTGLASCPVAAATIGDPRICANPPAPPTADPNRCAVGSAILTLTRAMSAKFASPGMTLLNLTCKGKDLRWVCVFSTSAAYTVYHSTITFSESAKGAWSAKVIASGTSCAVLPGPVSGGFRWRTGPAPVCT